MQKGSQRVWVLKIWDIFRPGKAQACHRRRNMGSPVKYGKVGNPTYSNSTKKQKICWQLLHKDTSSIDGKWTRNPKVIWKKLCHILPIDHTASPILHTNLPFPWGSWIPSNTQYLTHCLKWHVNKLSCFCKTHICYQWTNKLTARTHKELRLYQQPFH